MGECDLGGARRFCQANLLAAIGSFEDPSCGCPNWKVHRQPLKRRAGSGFCRPCNGSTGRRSCTGFVRAKPHAAGRGGVQAPVSGTHRPRDRHRRCRRTAVRAPPPSIA